MRALRAVPALLILSLFLVVGVLVGSYVAARGLRRLRSRADDGSGAPTPSDDVWAQHTVPDSNESSPDAGDDEASA